MPTDFVENTNGTNQGGNLRFANKPQTVPKGKERMPEGDQTDMRAIIHWSTHPQGDKNETKNLAMAWIDCKKSI